MGAGYQIGREADEPDVAPVVRSNFAGQRLASQQRPPPPSAAAAGTHFHHQRPSDRRAGSRTRLQRLCRQFGRRLAVIESGASGCRRYLRSSCRAMDGPTLDLS